MLGQVEIVQAYFNQWKYNDGVDDAGRSVLVQRKFIDSNLLLNY